MSGVASRPAPRVRVVVLNYDGGPRTLKCLDHLTRLDYPADRLELVMVDNASVDGVVWEVRDRFPQVRVIESLENRGFAGGNNLALRDLDGIDHVALVNNDAYVEPGFLRPLVDALEADRRLGAANAKILFADRFTGVEITAPTFVPGGDDQRELGVRVSGARVDGADVWDRLVWNLETAWPAEPGVGGEPGVRWTRGRSDIRLVAPAEGTPPEVMELRLSAERDKTVVLRTSGGRSEVRLGQEPQWVAATLGAPFDVINNVGSRLVEGGYGGDRGYLQRDEGQYDEPAEVFAWCGAAVLLRARYLREVGLFDERFFLYYEDTDLSWRGRLLGWRYRYVPGSVVRHEHSATSGEGSELFRFHVDRNRLLMLTKDAPAPLARAALRAYLDEAWMLTRREVLSPLRHRRRPELHLVPQRARSLRSYARLAPAMLRDRRALARRRVVGDDEIMGWMVPQQEPGP